MITRFWFVRHAPTHAKAAIGWTDIAADLTDTPQIERTAALIPADAVVVSSDLSRAIDTADAIQGDRTRLANLRELREFNFGDWENRTFDDIAKADPEASQAFWENPGPTAPPGGESFDELTSRVSLALQDLLERHPGGDICCVAHFGVILAAISMASEMTAKSALKFHIDNLSVSRIDHFHEPGSWSVRFVNHIR